MVEQLVTWCDRHYHRTDQELAFGTVQRHGWAEVWLEVHLCPECIEVMMGWTLAVTLEFFRDYGEDVTERVAMNQKVRSHPGSAKGAPQRAAAGTGSRGGSVLDPPLPCLYCPQTFTGRKYLERHLGRDHDLKDFWGSTCPLCGQEYARLAQHVVRNHELHASLAFAKAEAEGDPYGVVAARKKEVLGA